MGSTLARAIVGFKVALVSRASEYFQFGSHLQDRRCRRPPPMPRCRSGIHVALLPRISSRSPSLSRSAQAAGRRQAQGACRERAQREVDYLPLGN